jgi:hypothetical protein
MVDLIGELLTIFIVFAPIIPGFWWPPVRSKNGALTPWEIVAVVFGIAAGPLLLLTIPKNAGFGVIYSLAVFDLMLPVWGIGLARTTRPFQFALIGSSGYYVAMVVMYFTRPPDLDTTPPLLMMLIILGYIAVPALVVAIPFYIRVRWYLKRHPPRS